MRRGVDNVLDDDDVVATFAQRRWVASGVNRAYLQRCQNLARRVGECFIGFDGSDVFGKVTEDGGRISCGGADIENAVRRLDFCQLNEPREK